VVAGGDDARGVCLTAARRRPARLQRREDSRAELAALERVIAGLRSGLAGARMRAALDRLERRRAALMQIVYADEESRR